MHVKMSLADDINTDSEVRDGLKEVVEQQEQKIQRFHGMTDYTELFSSIHKPELVSVSEALRKNFGRVRCEGTIMGMSKLFDMISKVSFYCDDCQKLTEIDFPFPEFDEKSIRKRCSKCNEYIKNEMNPEFKSAVIIELQDTDSFNDLDRLPVFLFDNDTKDIRVGEKVM